MVYMAVGPSAPPIIPIEVAPSGEKPRAIAITKATAIPNCLKRHPKTSWMV